MRLGLFDSGVGGFTVLKKVIELCPNNSFIYLADTARIPYGVKTTNEITKIAEASVRPLQSFFKETKRKP